MIDRMLLGAAGAVLLVAAQSTSAQETAGGSVATSTAGRVGQRQTREEATSVEPMARINTRIQNRIELRLRTRIDRDYTPGADTVSPFATATERTRISGRPRRR